MQLLWQTEAWEDYLYRQKEDKKTLFRINDLIKDCLIKDCLRSPFKGIGIPELLKGNYSGCWSRRITDEHRLVYRIKGENLHIIQCRYHYS